MLLAYPILLFLASLGPAPQAEIIRSDISSDIPIVDYNGLEEYLKGFGDKTLVINFWATWCMPCVAELPYFEEANAFYASDGVEVILVSLDFSKQIESRLLPFVEKNNLSSHIIVLVDPDSNTWIDKVNPSWSGAIPATLIRGPNKDAFYEQSFHSFEELNQIIKPFINN